MTSRDPHRGRADIRSAHIATYAGQALDTFYLTLTGPGPRPRRGSALRSRRSSTPAGTVPGVHQPVDRLTATFKNLRGRGVCRSPTSTRRSATSGSPCSTPTRRCPWSSRSPMPRERAPRRRGLQALNPGQQVVKIVHGLISGPRRATRLLSKNPPTVVMLVGLQVRQDHPAGKSSVAGSGPGPPAARRRGPPAPERGDPFRGGGPAGRRAGLR